MKNNWRNKLLWNTNLPIEFLVIQADPTPDVREINAAIQKGFVYFYDVSDVVDADYIFWLVTKEKISQRKAQSIARRSWEEVN
ncbi:MAG: hypothetical protein WC346_06360 [Methanogenium sp.]|jgi:hypothetical protein